MVKVKEDMTGWKMWEHGVPDSKLIVIEQTDDYIASNGSHQARYLCKCNCGSDKKIIARAHKIKIGRIKSCGCLRLSFITKFNNYDLSGEYGIGYCSNTGSEFYFDLEDYDKIKDHCWYEHVTVHGYHSVRTNINTAGKYKTVYMHELLLGRLWNDHIDRNALNNRKSNLRPATAAENARNCSKQKRNTSGFIGVSLSSRGNKWCVYISVNGNQLYLGTFYNKEDAIIARLQAEAKYFGEFAPQRHLFEQYKINVDGGDSND